MDLKSIKLMKLIHTPKQMTSNSVSNKAGKTLLLNMEWFPQIGLEGGRWAGKVQLLHLAIHMQVCNCKCHTWHKTWACVFK